MAKTVDTITHAEAHRTNIPSAELQALMPKEDLAPIRLSYAKRNPDLDPQLIWRGKYSGDDELIVQAPPLYIQENIHSKVLINAFMQESQKQTADNTQGNLFADFEDFEGYAKGVNKTDFYQHDHNWTNRMILGDSLQVMASLAEREGLRGKVQCIYLDPPYGIKFNSNFQWSTTSRDVKDGKFDNLTREPEQVKAFRDTWRDGIHSYLSYLRDRLILARDLLTDSGSIFVQIGDENVHHVREVMDEIFGNKNFISNIIVTKTGSQSGLLLSNITDYVLWYAKDKSCIKCRNLFIARPYREEKTASTDPIVSSGFSVNTSAPFQFQNKIYNAGKVHHWKTSIVGMERLAKADRIIPRKNTLTYARYFEDYPVKETNNVWSDLGGASDFIYVVQTNNKIIQRCILMSTDPGDIVLDPTCGSGTTAYVAEQWGRRWITIDTSRVALALARMRLMGAKYPWYLLADSPEGQQKEAELNNKPPANKPTYNNIKLGFVYERVPHITLKAIANNTAIDTIYAQWQEILDPLRAEFNAANKSNYEEWEMPRELSEHSSKKVASLHKKWWDGRIKRQKEIDASIAANADYEYLYDKPYENKGVVRVAGPFTVESLSPHRILGLDADDELLDPATTQSGADSKDFADMILDNLRVAGVQQAHKEDKIEFTSLTPYPGTMLCAEGRYMEGEAEKRAAIFIGSEFGTVGRQDLVQAAREAAEDNFDLLVACAFNYDAQSTELLNFRRIPIIKARMNADLHLGKDLKTNGQGNLFVVFGEPDIEILHAPKDKEHKEEQIAVKIRGVDVFYPGTGEIRSDNADGIACWFIDTNYDDESFFVRQAYFLGANDPYKALRTTLKAEINAEMWQSLHSDTSRFFAKPSTGKIAVKVINHLGDEVMKVFKI